jgi:hypothetical protein
VCRIVAVLKEHRAVQALCIIYIFEVCSSMNVKQKVGGLYEQLYKNHHLDRFD